MFNHKSRQNVSLGLGIRAYRVFLYPRYFFPLCAQFNTFSSALSIFRVSVQGVDQKLGFWGFTSEAAE